MKHGAYHLSCDYDCCNHGNYNTKQELTLPTTMKTGFVTENSLSGIMGMFSWDSRQAATTSPPPALQFCNDTAQHTVTKQHTIIKQHTITVQHTVTKQHTITKLHTLSQQITITMQHTITKLHTITVQHTISWQHHYIATYHYIQLQSITVLHS